MADSVISELTDAPAGLLDTAEAEYTPSEHSTVSSTIHTALTHRLRPPSTSTSFIGHSFRHEGKVYQIREKTASKKGGKPSLIWVHGSELKCKQNQHPSWLCNLCWDRGRIEVFSVSNMTGSVQVQSRDPAPMRSKPRRRGLYNVEGP
jgi:hypothetical protein